MPVKDAARLAQKLADELQLELVDVELVKEPTGRFLRFFVRAAALSFCIFVDSPRLRLAKNLLEPQSAVADCQRCDFLTFPQEGRQSIPTSLPQTLLFSPNPRLLCYTQL